MGMRAASMHAARSFRLCAAACLAAACGSESGTATSQSPHDVEGLRVLHVEHPRAAPSDLFFDRRGRLVRIDNVVPKPDGLGSDRQRFDFEGSIEAGGLRWPRVMRISHDGQPYFELRLATLSVE